MPVLGDVARAFASVRKEKKGEDARVEGLLHASTSSAIDRADEGNAEKSPAAAAAPVTLFVRNDVGRTRTVHIELRASVAELEEAVRRKVPGTEEMQLCAVGGAPLVAARGLTDGGLTSHRGCPVREGEKWVATVFVRDGVSARAPWSAFDTQGRRRDGAG